MTHLLQVLGPKFRFFTGAACTLDCRITSPALICQCYSSINVWDKSVYKEKKPNMVPVFRGVSHAWLDLFTCAVISAEVGYNGGKKRAEECLLTWLLGTDREVHIGVPLSLQGHTPQWPKNSHQAPILKYSTTSTWLKYELLKNTPDPSSFWHLIWRPLSGLWYNCIDSQFPLRLIWTGLPYL